MHTEIAMSGSVENAIRAMWAALATELAHVAAVHAVFLLGVAGLLLSSAWAVVAARRAGTRLRLLAVASAGAVIQAVGQTWDLIEHARLTHGGPVAWAMIAIGPLIAISALVLRHRHERAGTPGNPERTSRLAR